ncbi:MAG: hypothetical protein JXA49_08745 [Actinobacteria bacterium]|nr:hypothetical protein [Actinomycetota bacterium]
MKRVIIFIMTIAVAMGLIAFLPGCGGGDTAKAKEYMQSGDKIMDEVEDESEDMDREMTDIIDATESGEVTSSSEAEENHETFIDNTDKLIEKAEEAKTEYKKILDLSDVADYREYAELSIEFIDTNMELLEEFGVLLEEFAVMFKGLEDGTITDTAESESIMAESFIKLSELSDKSDELEKDIEDLKETRNL